MGNTTSKRRPRIFVVGSFVMDQIAVTSKFLEEGKSVCRPAGVSTDHVICEADAAPGCAIIILHYGVEQPCSALLKAI